MKEVHVPVLLNETIEGLNLKKDSFVIDATTDGGGHAAEILKKLGPEGELAGIDADEDMIRLLEERFADEKRLKLFHLNFSDLEKVTKSSSAGGRRPDAILFDLGLSSLQLSASGRGFSFKAEGGLEMTFDRKRRPNAFDVVNTASREELEDIIREYGEDRFWRKIASGIIRARQQRKIQTAKELEEIISKIVRRKGRISPATKTFQALRIYVNEELENISKGLEEAWKILSSGGRIAVISYHSLEDRIVKKFFKKLAAERAGILIFKKPQAPTRAEMLENPRSRSAKLRIIEKK
ncbi:16S rRNA (cytosine(1402)-N(4))-methyltransferase RsmH [Candidatus Giovannonibacteria bacterium]|nr:16S rRNA (cytosine(1402)-N(4))-methyltransferase RsmH [Candidatus Giovannonibacteria bacterium]